MTEDSKKKTILFFCVKTFGYQDIIVEGLRRNNFDVFYYDERPTNSFLTKALLRLRSSLLKRRVTKYYRNILETISAEEINYLFVIRGEVVPRWFLMEFKKNHPRCETVFYTWDSFLNNPYPLNNLDLYDSKFSFDPGDCKNYDLSFRPLFFNDFFNYDKLNKTHRKEFLISFIGTLHSIRFEFFRKLESQLKAHGEIYSYFYIQNILVFLYRVYIEKSIKWIPLKNLSFKPLTQHFIRKTYLRSHFVLDINHPNQRGLTMRTIEVVGLRAKLITTNQHLKSYRFYNPDIFLVLNREDISLNDLKELRKNNSTIDKNFRDALSLEGWLKSIFIQCEPMEFWIAHED